MTIKRKTNITLLILGSIVLFLIFFVINNILSQIKKESENFIIQKKELLESEAKIRNIQDFRANFKQYQPNLEKIGNLFVNTAEPIEFIEFLEGEANASQLSIEIIPSVASEFRLNLKGSFPNFSRFIERLEYGPHLVKPVSLSIRKISNEKDEISAALLIKAYAK